MPATPAAPPGAPGALTVSVALCTHNGAAYVAEQVRSILGQTLPPVEIVLSDDDSADDTVRQVRDLVTAHATARPDAAVGLRVFENRPALGVARNFEQAMAACRGDLVALCDQDDRWEPGRLERVAGVFADRPDLMFLHSDARLVDGDGVPLGRTLAQTQAVSPAELAELRGGRGFATLLRRSLATGATVVIRRRLLDVALPLPASWVHDEWLAIVAAATSSHDFLPEVLGDYRQHAANVIGVRKRGPLAKVRKLLAPREARNQRLVERSEVLLERLTGLGAPDDVLDRARRKLEHERLRHGLSRWRLLRVRPVVREARRGGYDDFGRGRRDVARDLLQPAR